MTHNVKESLEDMSSDTVISQKGINDLKSGNTSQRISIDSVNLALSIQSEKKPRFLFQYWRWKMVISIRDEKKFTFGKKIFDWKI